MDYSKSNENKQQREIQNAYFGHTTLSIFTACCYLRGAENKIICESVTINNELSHHSRAAAIMSALTVITHLREKLQRLPLKINPIVWSAGCSAQFRSQFAFKLLSSIDSSKNITWFYNEKKHGKGLIEGTGRPSKNCVYRNVMSGKCVTDTPKQFAEYANKAVKGITSLYLPEEDVLIEPDDIKASPRIKDTLQIQMIKRFFDEQNVPYLPFSKMATDEKPFFTQFHGEGPCGLQKLLLMIKIVVNALETMNQLKNGFSA